MPRPRKRTTIGRMEGGSLALFAKSLLIGLSIAAPVGPIGLLCIQRSMQHGTRAGLATGLGAAVADAVYGAVGAFGVAWLIDVLSAARLPLALGGSAFLGWLAWRSWHAPVARGALAPAGSTLARHFAGTFVLTLSNPATILSFIAVFGALAGQGVVASPWLMVSGVLVGSALWWWALSGIVGRHRERIGERTMARINRASALIIAAFALWQVGATLRAA
jgi:threonine/homoserine/homoserine lactone efflux protein